MAYFSNSRPQSSSSAIKIVNPADHEDKAKLHKRGSALPSIRPSHPKSDNVR